MDLNPRKITPPSLFRPKRGPKIDIELQQERSVFTTGDPIQGSVLIVTEQDDSLGVPEIKLQGLTYRPHLKWHALLTN